MIAPRNSRGGGLIRFLVLVVLFFMFLGPLLRCAQQLPQIAANTAAHAASGVAGAAGNAVSNGASNLWQALVNRLKSLFGFARDQWDNASPAGKFDLVCEHIPVEGVDKLCPYFTSALQGASDAQTAQIACYWHAAATGPNPQQTLQLINSSCSSFANNPSGLQTCLARYVEPGDASTCLSTAPEQLWNELHTMIEPIACPPGLPKALCTTQSSSSATTAAPSTPPMRTDVNYLNCLQNYYLTPAVQAATGSSCGRQISMGNAACMKSQLQAFNYPGQTNLGQQYVAYCDAQPQ
jgi:hypothetical protein